MDLKNLNKNLRCIDYPGIVLDNQKALLTLGGILNISKAFAGNPKKLELNLRPDNAYCKPTLGNKEEVVGVVLKVKIKKKTNTVVSYDLLGHVDSEFTFTGLCDFQYLPVENNQCIYSDIVPLDLDLKFLSKDAPLFLPPTSFTRADTIASSLHFTKYLHKDGSDESSLHVKRKPLGFGIGFNFSDKNVPCEPPAELLSKKKFLNKTVFERIRKMFDERPIWTKAAVLSETCETPFSLKDLLPCFAYYNKSGPWRVLWTRYGYDPRKDSSSRIYQTFDYRARSEVQKSEIQLKRQARSKTGRPDFKPDSVNLNSTDDKNNANQYTYYPGMLPPARQYLLQFCDIHLPEIKALFENLEPIEEGEVCHAVRGWLPADFAEKARKIMNKYVSEELERRKEGNSNVIHENLESYYSASESELEDDVDDDLDFQ